MAGPGGPSLRSLAKQDKPTETRVVATRLLRYLLAHPSEVSAGVVWLLISSTAVAATPALTGRLIDVAVGAAGSGDASVLTLPALMLVGATLIGWFAQRMQILRLGQAGQMALYEVRGDVFAKIVELDVGYFEAVESGDLMSRLINDIDQISSFLSQGLRRLLSSAFGLVATLIFMVLVNWQLALATLLVVPVMLGVTSLFGMVARRAFRRRQESIGEVSATLAEELGGIKVAQAFNRTDRNRIEFESRNATNRDANIGAATVSSAFSPVLSVISTAATALVAALGGWSAAQGLITIGVVVAFLELRATVLQRDHAALVAVLRDSIGPRRRRAGLPAARHRVTGRRLTRCETRRGAARSYRVSRCPLRLSHRSRGASRREPHHRRR